VDVLITEATLGADPDAEKRKRLQEERQLSRAVKEVIQGEGSILIPAFSLGRTQEMLALLHRLRDRGYIPNVEIYSAGFGSTISALYDRTAKYTRRRAPDFRMAHLDILPLPSGNIARGPHLSAPSIILVSSGMMTPGTMSYKLANAMLEDPHHGIFFVGYVSPEMPGFQILNSKPGDTLQLDPEGPENAELTVRCRIEKFHFSAHSHRRHLLEMVERLNPKTVILVHGERGAVGWMRETIRGKFPGTEVVIAERGTQISLNGYKKKTPD